MDGVSSASHAVLAALSNFRPQQVNTRTLRPPDPRAVYSRGAGPAGNQEEGEASGSGQQEHFADYAGTGEMRPAVNGRILHFWLKTLFLDLFLKDSMRRDSDYHYRFFNSLDPKP